jgi:DNA replication and repair protein RecF
VTLALLSATRFRNLAPAAWQPGPGVHLLLGGNGAGKTSLLEAVYVLATAKSFRTGQLADCVRRGEDSFAVEGEVEGAARVRLAVCWSAAGKVRAVNGRTASIAEHLEVLPVVAWTAAEAELVTGAPVLRRRLLDRGLLGLRPAALAVLARYRQALAAKRELLARPPSGPAWAEQVEPWNELLAEAGAEIVRRRGDYAGRLAAELAAVAAAVPLPLPAIAAAYRPCPAQGGDDPGALAEALRRAAARERERRLPLVGPHRDDLALSWAGQPPRGSVSAGERKVLGLLLLAAHARVMAAAGRAPLVLLDDADAELAPATLAALWPVLAGAGRQLFASSNRPRVWEGLAVGTVHRLEGGRPAAAEGAGTQPLSS